MGAEAGCHLCRVRADNAAAQNDHLGGQHARHAAQQNAAAAEHLLQVLRAFLDGHATRHLAHRRQ